MVDIKTHLQGLSWQGVYRSHMASPRLHKM